MIDVPDISNVLSESTLPFFSLSKECKLTQPERLAWLHGDFQQSTLMKKKICPLKMGPDNHGLDNPGLDKLLKTVQARQLVMQHSIMKA